MIDIRNFYKLFIGNKETCIIWNEKENSWKRGFFRITKNLLLKHLNKEIAIGSYPIYKNDGNEYSRFICIDIDAHEDKEGEIDIKTKKNQEKFVRYLYSQSHIYLDLSKSCLLVEDSGGGYHIWIILKDKTPLLDAGKYIYKIKETLFKLKDNFCEGDIEFFPKQYILDHLDKNIGNAVRLPLGYNFNRKNNCKIICGNIENIIPADLSLIVKNISIDDIEKVNAIQKPTKPLQKFSAKDVSLGLHFWLEFPIRPCFKRIITGETQCHGITKGHKMRIALVHECSYYGMLIDMIIRCFENQSDFDRNKTEKQIKSVVKDSDWRYSCSLIKEMGYCFPECDRKK